MDLRSSWMIALVLAATTAAVGCTGPLPAADPPQPKGPVVEPAPPSRSQLAPTPSVPLPIRETRGQAMLIYDSARAGDWTTAARVLPALQSWVADVRDETIGDSSDVDTLESLSRDLRRSVMLHDRPATLRAANEVTRVVADLSDPYAPRIPTDLDRLAYYARALQMASETDGSAQLEKVIDELRQVWQRVRSQAVHCAPEGARRFDATLAKLQESRSVPACQLAAETALAAVATMQRSFQLSTAVCGAIGSGSPTSTSVAW